MHIKEEDIRIDFFKSSGPGGQRKNKKETAVRAVHLPTGISVLATESRTQARNKQIAIMRLKKRLKELLAKRKKRVPIRLPLAVKENILKEKKKRSQIKKSRKKNLESFLEDE
ncbi:MAG: peptide chain release factor-like protein [Candidatus Gygaella obscura]|nr:peptide chain release factor-like protein [Candidatus Gygaella obscura]